MHEDRSVLSLSAELIVCLWVIATQVWYYAHFKSLFGTVARAFLRR